VRRFVGSHTPTPLSPPPAPRPLGRACGWLKVDSPMELGADLRWVSIYPGEAEVLYPPLPGPSP